MRLQIAPHTSALSPVGAPSQAEAGHLVVIGQRGGRSWDEKVFHRQRRSEAGAPVKIRGM